MFVLWVALVMIAAAPTPFPKLAPLPTPSLPPWIVQISPNGPKGPGLVQRVESSTVAQVRIRFKEPLIAVEAIESPDQQRKLTFFHLTPSVPGRFRFLTPRLVGFEPDRELQFATRYHVTVGKGLSDLYGHRLDRDTTWSFETNPFSMSLPPDIHPYVLDPVLTIGASVELDLPSLQQRFTMTNDDDHTNVPVTISVQTRGYQYSPRPEDASDFPNGDQWWQYRINLAKPLKKATHYGFTVAPGVGPAWGNIATDSTIHDGIRTFEPLRFEGINLIPQPDGKTLFAGGDHFVEFNNTITDASARAGVSMTNVDPGNLVVSGQNLRIEPNLLRPDTSYTVTVDPDITDEFGQTLGSKASASFHNGNYSADFWAPDDFHIIATHSNLSLNLAAINLPTASYRAAYNVMNPLYLVYFSSAGPSDSDPRQLFNRGLLPLLEQWQSYGLSGPKNQPVEVPLPARTLLGGAPGLVAYGLEADAWQYLEDADHVQYAKPTYYGMEEITDLGVFAQVFPDGAQVRVHTLSEGRPVPGATASFFIRHVDARNRPRPSPCATATTDLSGTATFDMAAIAPCFAEPTNQSDGNSPRLLLTIQSGNDWAFLSFDRRPWQYGLAEVWDNGQVESRGAIFPDRDLYQPGETATFAGAAFYLQHDQLKRDAGSRYAISIADESGVTTQEGSRIADVYGAFAIAVRLSKKQRPGYYRIVADAGGGKILSGTFRVAEFKPPTFTTDLSVSEDIAVAGETVRTHAVGNYLFGAPLAGGKASWYVTRERWSPGPWGMQSLWHDWDGYAFGKLWIPPDAMPAVSHDALKTVTPFSNNGVARQDIVLAKRLPYWLTYMVEVEASDATHRTVAASHAFVVLPAPEVIGLGVTWSPVRAGTPVSVNVIVTDRRAKAVAGRIVRLELQRQIVGSGNKASYSTVGTATVTSGAAAVAAKLLPPVEGVYRIRANFDGAADDAAETDTGLTAVRNLPTPAPSPLPAASAEAAVSIEFSNPSPKPGDVEDATISLPYDDADLYVAAVRHGVFNQAKMHAVGGTAHFAFTVTAAMAPNIFVEAHAVRRGPPHNGVTALPGQTLSKFGLAWLSVDISDRKLIASVSALKARLAPGARETLQLHLRDKRGHAARGEFSVAVVDDSLLRLTGYRPPALFQSVWGWFPAPTMIGDNRDDVLLAPLPQQLLRRFGYGQSEPAHQFAPSMAADVYSTNAINSGRSVKTIGRVSVAGGATVVNGGVTIVVRQSFRPLAYFNGALRTDNAGNASVTFKVPDDLTTWRVMVEAIGAPQASAAGADLRFGQAETTFVTHKSLALTPLLPQFARPRDRVRAGVNVTNDTGTAGTVVIHARVSGPLAFESGARLTTSASLSKRMSPGTAGQRFPVLATGWGTGLVEFDALLRRDSDAFEVPLPVLPLEVTEHVVETGTTLGSIAIPINVDPHVDKSVGGLNVTLASTLLPEITVPATQVLSDIDIPLLEPSASRLAIAADLRVLDAKFKRPVTRFDPMSVAATELDHLVELQNEDGGFSYWPLENISDSWDSAYAAESLGRAVAAGIPVDPKMISNLQKYLRNVIDNPSPFVPLCDYVCKERLRLDAMLGLRALGEQRADHVADVYAVRNDFGLVGRVKLARLLTITPGWERQAKSLTAKEQEIVYETGRYATVDVPEGWWWYDSVPCAQSQMLRLFVAQRVNPEILDRVLNGLVARQRNGSWRNSYDTAQALAAILEYARLEPLPPNFSATATLAGQQVGATTFAGYQDTMHQLNVRMAKLPRNRSDLVLSKSGTGRLHYVVEYGYRLMGTQQGRVNGFRLERRVSEANQTAILQRVGLAPPRSPGLLAVGRVFDIDLHIIVDHPVDRVIVTDPLPGGLEAIDQSFLTTTLYYQPKGWNWRFDYQTIYRDRVVLYADQLGPGAYDVHYLVRSVTPGAFLWPGASAYLLYAPEEFGRTASSTLEIVGL